MMSKTPADYVRDMLNELDDVTDFTKDGKTAFESDVKTQKAVIRCYEVMGEIAKRLPQSLRDKHPDVDWRKLIGFRDFLAHNYDKVVVRFLWEAVEDTAKLKEAVTAILAELDIPKE